MGSAWPWVAQAEFQAHLDALLFGFKLLAALGTLGALSVTAYLSLRRLYRYHRDTLRIMGYGLLGVAGAFCSLFTLKDNCVNFAMRRYFQEGGYIVFERSKRWKGFHCRWSPDLQFWEEYNPVGPKTDRVIPPLVFEGVIECGQYLEEITCDTCDDNSIGGC